jgi:hypothetical protein
MFEVPKQKKQNSEVTDITTEVSKLKFTEDLRRFADMNSFEEYLEELERVASTSDYVPDGFINLAIGKCSSLEEAKQVLQLFIKRFNKVATTQQVNQVLQRPDITVGHAGLLEQLCEEYAVEPDNNSLKIVVSKAKSYHTAQMAISEFTAKHPDVPVEIGAVNSVLSKLPALSRALETISQLCQKYHVTPNESTYKVALLKVLSVARPTQETLKETREIITALSKYGWNVEEAVAKKDSPWPLYIARFYFLEGRVNDAFKLISPLLQQSVPTRSVKEILLPMILAFTPEQHPLRKAIVSSFIEHGMSDVIKYAEVKSRSFNDVFEQWIETQEQHTADKFGGGSVYDQLHTAPIDKNAARTVPKP